MKAIATEFGLEARDRDRLMPSPPSAILLKQVEQGRESVLIIDEAQNLTEELLEQVRLLSTSNRRPQVAANRPARPAGVADRLNSPRCGSFASASRCVIISGRSRASR